MKRLFAIFFMLVVLFSGYSSGQGYNCSSANPICEENSYTFPVGVNAGTADTSADYGCLMSQPNPAWFYLQVTDSGNIEFEMSNLSNYDVDFACWGPFDQYPTACNGGLTSDTTITHPGPGPSPAYPSLNMVDCSYSASNTEYCYIPNAPRAAYYILLITNYANTPGYISILHSNQGSPDAGSFLCDLIPGAPEVNSPVCEGDTIFLQGYTDSIHPFYWTGPNGFSSTLLDPVIPDVDENDEGNYILVMDVDGLSTYEGVYIDVIAPPVSNFSYTIMDDAVWFRILSAGDSNIFDFGDGDSTILVANNDSFMHYYSAYGVYSASLYSYNQCFTDSISQLLDVNSVSDETGSELVLYPNPTNGKCMIEGIDLNEIEQVQCRSIDGKLLFSGPPAGLKDGSITVADLSACCPGIYLLTLHTRTAVYNARVIRTSE